MQQSLFSETGNIKKDTQSIIRIQDSKNTLSKEQQAFNKLTARINTLQKRIKETEDYMGHLSEIYQKEIYTKILVLSGLKIQLAHLMDQKREQVKLSQKNSEMLDEIISDLLNDALSVAEPDEDTKALYERYSGEGVYEEEIREQEDAMKQDFADFLKEQFGVNLDAEMLTDNPDYDKIQESLEAQFEEQKAKNLKRKKTKKQLEKESLEEQKENIKNKSLRSIYLSLAKILHPDTHGDELLRTEKEEMMKKVTVAYNKKDMMELLRLEMQWVRTQENSLASVDIDTIKIYVQLLKDQVKELEQNLFSIRFNPAYQNVGHLAEHTRIMAEKELLKTAKGYNNYNRKVAGDIEELKNGTKTRATLVQCIDEYYVVDLPEFDEADFLNDAIETLLRKNKGQNHWS